MTAGNTSCDTLMNSMAGENLTVFGDYDQFINGKRISVNVMNFQMAEGAHWGEDDWEACEVTSLNFSENRTSIFPDHNFFCGKAIQFCQRL